MPVASYPPEAFEMWWVLFANHGSSMKDHCQDQPFIVAIQCDDIGEAMSRMVALGYPIAAHNAYTTSIGMYVPIQMYEGGRYVRSLHESWMGNSEWIDPEPAWNDLRAVMHLDDGRVFHALYPNGK